MNEESKKAGNAENENPLASSSGTTIRSFSHCLARSAGGALGCCFPTFLIYKSGVRHGRPGQRFILYFPWTTIACGPAGRGDFFPKHRAKSPVLCAGGLSGREAIVRGQKRQSGVRSGSDLNAAYLGAVMHFGIGLPGAAPTARK